MDQVRRSLDQSEHHGDDNDAFAATPAGGGEAGRESAEKQRQMLENELMRVNGQLQISHKVI